MDLISFIIGFITALIIITFISKQKKIHGFIDIDAKKGLCKFHISSMSLANRKVKHAIFVVNHDVNLIDDSDYSRDELAL